MHVRKPRNVRAFWAERGRESSYRDCVAAREGMQISRKNNTLRRQTMANAAIENDKDLGGL